MGRVMARTWYEAQETARLDEVYRVRTGRTIEQKYFGLGKASLPYKKEEMTFKEYDLVSKKEGLVRIDTYYEVELKAWPDNLEEAKKYIEKSTEERLMQEIAKGTKVVDKKLKYDIIEGEQITGVLYLELIEDIGIQEDLTIQ
jgi:similar to stage IV sporulation protein